MYYKIQELLSYKIEKVLESLIRKEELEQISKDTIKEGKFKIYDKVQDIFRDVKFERKK